MHPVSSVPFHAAYLLTRTPSVDLCTTLSMGVYIHWSSCHECCLPAIILRCSSDMLIPIHLQSEWFSCCLQNGVFKQQLLGSHDTRSVFLTGKTFLKKKLAHLLLVLQRSQFSHFSGTRAAMPETLMHTLPSKKAEKYVHKHGKDYLLLILNRHTVFVWQMMQFQCVVYIILMIKKCLLLLSTKGHFHHNNSLNVTHLYIILLKSTQVLFWHYLVFFFFSLVKTADYSYYL